MLSINGKVYLFKRATFLLTASVLSAVAACIFLATPKVEAAKVSSGTGFFVSNTGYIVTNEHVVKGCSSVGIRGAVPATTAVVMDIDEAGDLALLKAEASPGMIAPISRSLARLKVGEPVLVMGYPGEHGISGNYVAVEASIVSLDGPLGEDKWIEFSSSAEQGNSGGPLLDTQGNVVGVIVGKAYITRLSSVTKKQQVIRQTDVAISLPVLEKFLRKNKIFYRKEGLGFSYTSGQLESFARQYIVNIHCLPPETVNQ